MNKKIVYIYILLLIAAVSGYALYMTILPGEQTGERENEEKLPGPELEGVEENINAYNIDNDFQITRELQRDEDGFLALNPRQTAEILQEIGPKRKNTVLHQYQTTLPEGINRAIQYPYYNISYDYFLVTAAGGAKIRENPDPETRAVAGVENLDKLSLLQRVDGESIVGSNIWYRIAVKTDDQIGEGYLHSANGIPRRFRFTRMKEAINNLIQEVSRGDLHFVSNYRNQNGTPPRMGEIAVDEHGYRVYHSAPAYVEPSTEADYRYVPDGMLVRVLEERDDFYYVDILSFEGNFYIPRQYIDREASLSQLKHVVVVDNTQQNQAAFELNEDGITLISYTLATTGKEGDYSFITSPGIYKVLEKRERFEYLKKDSTDIGGFAPFATRFSGGAYVHGVPVPYIEQGGEKIDPGLQEYIHTIGTFPRSSMCVRNFTSHAEFLYNWMDIENGAVIVID